MKDIKLLAKELLSLTNKSECVESTIERMKNLICYLSEHKKIIKVRKKIKID